MSDAQEQGPGGGSTVPAAGGGEYRLTSVAGGLPHMDAQIDAAAEEAKEMGKPLRVRIQPHIWPQADNFYALRGHTWTVELPSGEAVKRFRGDLDTFLRGWVETMAAAGAGDVPRETSPAGGGQ